MQNEWYQSNNLGVFQGDLFPDNDNEFVPSQKHNAIRTVVHAQAEAVS